MDRYAVSCGARELRQILPQELDAGGVVSEPWNVRYWHNTCGATPVNASAIASRCVTLAKNLIRLTSAARFSKFATSQRCARPSSCFLDLAQLLFVSDC